MRAAILYLSLLLATPAAAVGMSMGHEMLPQGVTQTACLDLAARVAAGEGLRQLNRDGRAIWAENQAGDELYGIYCIAERGMVTVTGAADQAEAVSQMVARLRAALRGEGSPRRK